MLVLFLCLISVSFTSGQSARYAKFQESYVPAIGDFAANGNVVYLGAKSKILKLHFARREFVAQFEVLSSKCDLGDNSCSDYTQHVLLADGRLFGVSNCSFVKLFVLSSVYHLKFYKFLDFIKFVS